MCGGVSFVATTPVHHHTRIFAPARIILRQKKCEMKKIYYKDCKIYKQI